MDKSLAFLMNRKDPKPRSGPIETAQENLGSTNKFSKRLKFSNFNKRLSNPSFYRKFNPGLVKCAQRLATYLFQALHSAFSRKTGSAPPSH
jgi:hypothetical protein